jgi:hypothetical protein
MNAGAPRPGPRPAAGNRADPAVVKFEIEWIAGADFRRFGQNPRNTVADHDVAPREQAFVTFRVGGEPSAEIVERVMASVDKARHRIAQPGLELGGAGA